ncbi:MAG: hypothetical protein IIA82_08465 [Thaumarchaeota archaeon]|nr:hypothetical protein [Nitrososphaerota archaeon]
MSEIKELIKQNKFIISLLGRLVFPEEKLIAIIQKNSKKPKELLKAYNLCNGKFTLTEIAKKSGVASQSLGQTILKWKKNGIILVEDSLGKGIEIKPLRLYEVNEVPE